VRCADGDHQDPVGCSVAGWDPLYMLYVMLVSIKTVSRLTPPVRDSCTRDSVSQMSLRG
jgi:hypothetical protein